MQEEKLQHVFQVLRLDTFSPASIEDMCKLHERSYVLGLEKLVRQGKEDMWVESSPTYITSSSFDDALRVSNLLHAELCLSTPPFARSGCRLYM